MSGEVLTVGNTVKPDTICCGNCVCASPDEAKPGEGTCRRFPPQIVSVSARTLQGIGMVPGAMFPQINTQDARYYCMEFKPNEAMREFLENQKKNGGSGQGTH